MLLVEQSRGSVENFPQDVLELIVKYLRAQEVVQLSSTCKRLYQVCSQDKVWIRLYLADFMVLPSPSEGVLVRGLYSERVLNELETRMMNRKRAQQVDRPPQRLKPTPRFFVDILGDKLVNPVIYLSSLFACALIAAALADETLVPYVFLPIWIAMFMLGYSVCLGMLLCYDRICYGHLLFEKYDSHNNLFQCWYNVVVERIDPNDTLKRYFVIGTAFMLYVYAMIFCLLLTLQVCSRATWFTWWQVFIPIWLFEINTILVVLNPRMSYACG
jgi:hypothetical protein